MIIVRVLELYVFFECFIYICVFLLSVWYKLYVFLLIDVRDSVEFVYFIVFYKIEVCICKFFYV